ncbi:hypothetical protein FsymDg_4058 [Candidatus Protofrankia datiscae]|uniref:Uncharacterized protein n=1 Tax=Candidatus Protofrankia datiscae TaxID=2716812 RepID=F8AW08_9ACTN|nr:hypothetical protein FsymDg_4058 [Candidatus Protofrankia datiscae]
MNPVMTVTIMRYPPYGPARQTWAVGWQAAG